MAGFYLRQLPRKLRDWKPEEKLPEGVRLPPVTDEYWEIEAAKAHGYRWPDEWQALDARFRGRLLAHESEKNMRDSYYAEQRMKGASGEESPVKRMSPKDIVKAAFYKPGT